MALFQGPPVWAGARRELLDFMMQRKINGGRHTDHLAGRHSIRTNQCPSPPSPHPIFFTGRMPFLPPSQQHQSTKGNKYSNNNEQEMLRWDHSPAVGQTWDVTVPDTYAESYTGSTATKPGAAAQKTAQNKINKCANWPALTFSMVGGEVSRV